ncbi:hypothetical protein Mgra_00008280, partial [Meloidogyne graminicola]
MNLRRMSDCIVISPSDMIVIDYPDVQRITVHLHNNSDNIINQSGNQSVISNTSFQSYEGPSSSSLSSSPLTTGTPSHSLLVRRQSGDNSGWKGNNHPGIKIMTLASPTSQRSSVPIPHRHQQQQYSNKYPHHRIPPNIPTSSNQQLFCHQHNNNSSLYHQQQQSSIQQIPITNSPAFCHRVPSPAPTFSSSIKDNITSLTQLYFIFSR